MKNNKMLIIINNKCPLCKRSKLIKSNIQMPNQCTLKCLECNKCNSYFLDSKSFNTLHNAAYRINRKVKKNVYKCIQDAPKPIIVDKISAQYYKDKNRNKPKLNNKNILPKTKITLNPSFIEKSKRNRLINPKCSKYKNGFCLFANKKCDSKSNWCANKSYTSVNKKKNVLQENKTSSNEIFNNHKYITSIVLNDNRKCIYMEHHLSDFNGIIKVVTPNGDVLDKSVLISYCEECDNFIMLKSEYLHLKKQYALLCEIIDYSNNKTKKYPLHKILSSNESRIHRMGYNVIKSEKNTKIQRQVILSNIIENTNISRSEIISCIQRPLSQHKNQSNYQDAVKCWTEDIEFVKSYKHGDMPDVIVEKLIIGRRK